MARMGERRGTNRVLVGNLRERNHLKDLGVEEVDNSKNISSRSGMWRYRLDRAGSGYRQVAGTCCNAATGPTKCG